MAAASKQAIPPVAITPRASQSAFRGDQGFVVREFN